MTPDEQFESRANNSSFVSDDGWDHTKCRCENNGDYCDYCADFYDPETIVQRCSDAAEREF